MKRFIPPIFVVITSLLIIGDLYALSYWDAIFQLGYEPTTQRVNQGLACQRIERIYRFRQLISRHLAADHNLLNKLRDLDARVTSLDVSNVYDLLPYSDADGVWRAIGVRGQSDSDVYRLNEFDPHVTEWLNASQNADTGIAGTQNHFGDFGVGIFIRPVPQDTFKFLTEARLHLDDIPAANLIRVFDGVLATTWTYAAGVANDSTDSSEKIALDRQNQNILKGISKDFPNLFGIISQYCHIENIVSANNRNTDDSIGYHIRIRFDHVAISRHYPEFGKLLKKWGEIVKFKARVFDKNSRLMGLFELDSANDLLDIQFRTSRDRFIPMQNNRILTINDGLSNAGATEFKIDCDIHLNIVGMQLKIDRLPVVLDYRNSDGEPHLKARLAQTPQKIEAGGSVYGVIPVWLVNLMIPSNVQEIMNRFFQTLAVGNDGDGSMVKIYSFPQPASKQSFLLETDAAVLANGTIKLGFNLQRKFFAVPPKLPAEIRAFKNRLWNALYADYRRFIQMSGVCPPAGVSRQWGS